MKNKLLIILISTFLLELILYYFNLLYLIDDPFYDFVKLIINDENTIIFKIITQFGSLLFIIIGLIILLLIKFKYFLFMLINMSLECVLNSSLKYLIMRQRPSVNRIINESGYSFPSGHAMAAITFYGLLMFFIKGSSIDNKIKKYLYFVLIILVLLICLSRVYLGVHFLTDIIAGLLVGSIWLVIYTDLIKNKFSEI